MSKWWKLPICSQYWRIAIYRGLLQNLIMHKLYEGYLIFNLELGFCPLETKCRYAHDESELWYTSYLIKIIILISN